MKIKTINLFILFVILGLSVLQPQAKAQNVIGCNPDVLERKEDVVEGLKRLNSEIAREYIQPPTLAEQLTCQDQQMEMLNEIGGIQAVPGGDISATLTPFAIDPLVNEIETFLNGIGGFVSPIMSAINGSFSGIAGAFMDAIGFGGFGGDGGGGGTPEAECGMMEQAWLINECMPMPEVYTVADVLGGYGEEVATDVWEFFSDAADPDRYIQEMCSAAGGYVGDLDAELNAAARAAGRAMTVQ